MREMFKMVISPLYWLVMRYLKGCHVQSSQVGFRAKIGRGVIIRKGSEVGSLVVIDSYSYISGPRSYVEAATIGKYCSIARQTTIGVSDHNYNLVTTHPIVIDPTYGFIIEHKKETQKAAPIIGNDVWIGMGSFVMRGTKIGDGAVIAANSVVTKDVDPYSIVAGNPAKHIKYRFERHIIASLMKIEWWNWDDDKIRHNAADFYDVNTFVNKHCP